MVSQEMKGSGEWWLWARSGFCGEGGFSVGSWLGSSSMRLGRQADRIQRAAKSKRDLVSHWAAQQLPDGSVAAAAFAAQLAAASRQAGTPAGVWR